MEISIFELLKQNGEVRIKLNQEFINFTRRQILKKFRNLKDAYKKMNLNSYDSLINWLKPTEKHQTNALFRDFIGLINNFDIPQKTLFNNILGFSLWGSPRITNLPSKITFTEDLITAIGLYVGDGYTSKKAKRIVFTNSDLRLVKFFKQTMLEECLKTPRNEMFIYAYTQELRTVNKKIIQERLLIKPFQIKIYRGGPKRPNYKFGTYSYVRWIVLDLLIKETKEICLRNKTFAKAYLRGMFLAEGNIDFRPDKYARSLTIEMADKKEIEFLKKLLKIFKIRCGVYKNVRGYHVLTIGYRKGIEKLRDLGIFNLIKEKQKLLEEMCSSYTSKRSRWWT